MNISEAKYHANRRYNEKTYDHVVVKVRKYAEINADVIRRYAESKDMSVNALILGLIEERIRNDEDFMI